MAILKPFKGIRPTKDMVKKVTSKPYDVLNEVEARIEAGDNPYSFYRIIKPEIEFADSFNHYAPEVYQKGRANFDKFVKDGVLAQDTTECLYIYQQTMDGKKQTGIVGSASVDDYFNDIIKKHELTRPDKEEDRKNHVRYGKMNAEPVFFAYPAVADIDTIVN
jgi:uncharacterized protein (DUF1015 family)